MSQANQSVLASGRNHSVAAAFGLGLAVGALVVAIAIGSVQALRSASETTPSIGATTSDPYLTPAAVEFRAGERSVGAAAADPYLSPTMVQFRADERAVGAAQADPFLTPNAIDFRSEERSVDR